MSGLRTDTDRPADAGERPAPSVLVVLVVRDGSPWLGDCLAGLSAQTYSRLGVIAVDNGSTDGSRELLVESLGDSRVLEVEGDPAGLPAAVHAALQLEQVREADYLLILHDDVVLALDAVERLVETAEEIEVEGVGIVGPKVVDWDDPRVLLEVGASSDRFGHPYSPLEPSEIDHGQYDRIREVLFVSSCAMLVSRGAWLRAGAPDERLGSHQEDLDFCWRVRLAGFRVLWSPAAVVRHRSASGRGERQGDRSPQRSRFYEERAGLAAILKNYGFFSLLWILPLYAIQGLVKLIAFVVARRFEDAYQLVAAWGWNFIHLPSTIKRRIKTQAARAIRDRVVHRYMAHGSVRFRRWLDVAGRVLPGDVDVPEDEEMAPAIPLRRRAASAAREHPVAAAWVLTAIVAWFSFRRLIGPEQLTGGALPMFPAAPGDFFRELVSGVRTTVLGGTQAGSPALGLLGGASAVLFRSTALAQEALLVLLPLLAAHSMYRAIERQAEQKVAALAGAACYALSAATFWALSNGRIPELVFLAVLPRIADRLALAFGEKVSGRRLRFIVGTGVFFAVGIAFFPGTVLAVGLLLAVFFLAPERGRRRPPGLVLSVGFAIVAALLVFPQALDLLIGSGRGLSSGIGEANVASLARLVLGKSGAAWRVTWFLPAAALLSFGLVRAEQRQAAFRYLFAAVAGLFLAWASAAGYLPAMFSNPTAYIGVAAISYCSLVGLGLAAIGEGQLSGMRRLTAGFATVLVIGGISMQALLAVSSSWEIGPDRLPPAWPIVADGGSGEFRVLWIGGAPGRPFPAPGGDPTGAVEAGPDTLRYAVTERDGISALDIGRSPAGDGHGYLEEVLTELLSGTSRHGGALLGPLGIRYVVAEEG